MPPELADHKFFGLEGALADYCGANAAQMSRKIFPAGRQHFHSPGRQHFHGPGRQHFHGPGRPTAPSRALKSAPRVAPASQPAVAWASLPTLPPRQHFMVVGGPPRHLRPEICPESSAGFPAGCSVGILAHAPSAPTFHGRGRPTAPCLTVVAARKSQPGRIPAISGRWPTHRSQSRRRCTHHCAPVHRSFIAMSGPSPRPVQIPDRSAVDRLLDPASRFSPRKR